MINRSSLLLASICLVLLSACYLLGMCVKWSNAHAQDITSSSVGGGCSRASSNGIAWKKGATVYYSFENIPDSPQKNQIKQAITIWNDKNTKNCSGVKFIEGVPPIPTDTTLAYPTLIFKNDDISDQGVPAETKKRIQLLLTLTLFRERP